MRITDCTKIKLSAIMGQSKLQFEKKRGEIPNEVSGRSKSWEFNYQKRGAFQTEVNVSSKYMWTYKTNLKDGRETYQDTVSLLCFTELIPSWTGTWNLNFYKLNYI